MKLLPYALALSFVLPTAYAEKKTPEQYWQETGISTDYMIKLGFLSPNNCSSSLEALQGCVAAINSVGARADNPIEIVPATLSADPMFVGGMPFRMYPDFILAARPKLDKDMTLTQARTRADQKREKLKEALRQILAKQPTADFEKIFGDLLKYTMKDKQEDAMIAAAAMNAFITTSMDAHAHLDPTAQVADSLKDASEDFVGIGANLQALNGHTVVLSPTEGGPAAKAGLLPNDIIAAVDGVNTDGVGIDEVVKKIRGVEGTIVKLGLLRKGKTVEVSIKRSRIVIENVTANMHSTFGAPVGFIKLRNFMDSNACDRIASAIKKFEAKKAQGIVLDLRGNGGGLLDQAICIGGLFVGRQPIVKVKDLQSDSFQDLRSDREQITRLPLAVLIDAGSASASEVLSGALQDHKRAWILGERSFGKASVQAPQPFLGNDRVSFYHTIQRFYQPSGRTNQIVGIQPDLTVPVKPDATDDERFALREGDLFPNALAAVGDPWQQPRAGELSQLASCMDHGAMAKAKYAQAKTASEAVDYQALAAEEAIDCRIP